MKTIFMTMAAVSALALTAPASAQSWNSHQTHSAELRMQIDAGVESGAISRREMAPLRDSLRQLVALERQFSANGISGREHASLQQRSATLRRQITLAARSGPARTEYDGRGGDERRAAWEDRYDREHRADWEARYTTERLAAWESRFGRDQRSSPKPQSPPTVFLERNISDRAAIRRYRCHRNVVGLRELPDRHSLDAVRGF